MHINTYTIVKWAENKTKRHNKEDQGVAHDVEEVVWKYAKKLCEEKYSASVDS